MHICSNFTVSKHSQLPENFECQTKWNSFLFFLFLFTLFAPVLRSNILSYRWLRFACSKIDIRSHQFTNIDRRFAFSSVFISKKEHNFLWNLKWSNCSASNRNRRDFSLCLVTFNFMPRSRPARASLALHERPRATQRRVPQINK